MRWHEIDEIRGRILRGRTKFHYFRDRYALMLLAWAAGEGRPVRELRAGRLAPLLRKPIVRDVLAAAGDGRLTPARLDAAWPADCETYVLTVGAWGREGRWDRWWQTSRAGVNLVLQLNFSNRHDVPYRRLVRPGPGRRPFEWACHPNATNGRSTLAWARLDVDRAGGEALVEEIQSDWIVGALDQYAWIRGARGKERERRARQAADCDRATADGFGRYVETVLRPHARLWSEAMLSAALWLLHERLGVRRAWYHTFEGGLAVKGQRREDGAPPRSLYTALPRRFCFVETDEAPGFLRAADDRRLRKVLRRVRPRWFVADLADPA